MNDSTTKNVNVNTKKGCPWAALITIVLIIAKVWGGADINWLFCFAPILIALGLTFLALIIGIIATLIVSRW